jgi:hypothetical protein
MNDLPACECGSQGPGLIRDDERLWCPGCVLTELTDLQQTFELLWQAEQRGIKCWQQATGRHLTWPDTANFTLWLLRRLEQADTVIQAAREVVQHERQVDAELSEADARLVHLALHVLGYDREYPTSLNDPEAECCQIGTDAQTAKRGD